jgi:predicted acylesterase/phospholipase RssA
VLQQLGIVVPGKQAPPVAGISSGALTAGVICSGMSADRFGDTVRPLAWGGRGVGKVGGVERMGALLAASVKFEMYAAGTVPGILVMMSPGEQLCNITG